MGAAVDNLNLQHQHKWRYLLILLVSTAIAAMYWYLIEERGWKLLLSAYLYTFSLWEGNYWFALWAIHKYPRLSDMRGRLFASLLFIFIYTLLICLLWEGILFQYDITIKKFVALYIFSVFVTFLVSATNGAISYFLLFVRSIEEKESIRRAHMENEIKVLTSQVNPHFLFNSLNTLISLIPEDKETAVRFTQKLSDVYRYVLQGKNKDLISLEEEINFLENYIFLLKIRYGSNLIVEKKVEPEALLRQLPVLSSQLIIENAIKHNTISASKPLRVGITANQNWLTVVNNRNEKLVEEPGTGTGLENIRKRYALYSTEDIRVEDTKEYFSVRIPLLKVARYESIDH